MTFDAGARVQGRHTTRSRAQHGTVVSGGNGWIRVDWDDPGNDVIDTIVWHTDIQLLS